MTPQQLAAFKAAVRDMVDDLREKRPFRASLRIKRVQGTECVWEMSWAGDGRATWEYGKEEIPGEVHVIWRRVGTHSIFRRP